MKTKNSGLMLYTILFLPLVLMLMARPAALFAQGTAFTYQGRLNDAGGLASGAYDLRFKLFTDPLGNQQAGSTVLTNAVPISNGLFAVTLDFGPGLFNGSNYWLEIDVKTNGGAGYVDLSPFQAVTPVPYAVFAENAASGGLAAGIYTNLVTLNNFSNNFNGNFSGNGGGLTNVNATTLGGLGSPNFWQTGGNTGTSATNGNFIGTTDNQPLEIRVNGQRALRLEPNTNGMPNTIAGAPNNYVDPGVVGATIAGGGALNQTISTFLPGPNSNHVAAIFGAIGGGRMNTVGADHGTISGGLNNTIQTFGYDGVIGGGFGNTIRTNTFRSVIGGGSANQVGPNISFAVIGGGVNNAVQEGSSTISGGEGNTIQPLADRSVIAGGGNNRIIGSAAFSVYSTIGGGQANLVQTNGIFSAVGGGQGNTVGSNSAYATISGGSSNAASGSFTTVGGGSNNVAAGSFATVSGGGNNLASAKNSVVGGGTNNVAAGDGGVVSGGYNNRANLNYTAIGGGYGNVANGADATVPGGSLNVAAGVASFAAGSGAQALHDASFVWSDGQTFFASTAPRQFSVAAAGGVLLAANVQIGTGPGDYRNLGLGGGNSEGFLYGSYPALGDGIHLGYNWYYDAGGGGHVYNAGGGTSRISVQYGRIELAVGGVASAPLTDRLVADSGGVTVFGTFNNLSDRNAKQDFAPVSSTEILEAVVELPISRWSYKEDAATRHLGPVAQDFHAAFRIGTDDRHIAPIDEGGVALAAIQGLNQKIEERERSIESRLKDKDAEIEGLQKQIAELRSLVLKLNQHPPSSLTVNSRIQ